MIFHQWQCEFRYPRGASKNVWCTSEGELIPVALLETDHLRNIIKLLMRRSFDLKLKAARRKSPAETKKLMVMPPYEFLSKHVPTWDALIREAIERRIIFSR